MSFTNSFLNGDAYNNCQHPPYKYKVQPSVPYFDQSTLPPKNSPLAKFGNTVVSPIAKNMISPKKIEVFRREVTRHASDSIDLTKNSYPVEPVKPNSNIPSLSYGSHVPVNLSKGKPTDFSGNSKAGYYRAQLVPNQRQKNVDNILAK